MIKYAGGILAALLVSTAAFAGDTDGRITAIDRDKLMITLDDGNSYRLPGEFDMEGIEEGMEILIAWDEINGVKQITDMELYEQ